MTPDPRPVRLPREERRAQLMDAARGLFAAHGYAGTSMDVIAEQASVSKPVLYQHFGGKHELFLELLDQEADKLWTALQAALAAPDTNRERAHATVHAVFRYMDSPGCTHRILFESGAEHDPAVHARLERVRAGMTSEVASILDGQTVVMGGKAEVVARGVVEMVLGAARHWADHVEKDGRPTAEETAAAVQELLWLGLEAIPDRDDVVG